MHDGVGGVNDNLGDGNGSGAVSGGIIPMGAAEGGVGDMAW